jgi:hypothetical protein
LAFVVATALIYIGLVPWHYYSDDHNVRALAIAFLSGALVGATEILSRYRDEQVKAILSPDGLLYVLFNGAVSTFALILIFRFENSVPGLSFFKGNSLTAAIAAGFGSTAIMRTRIAVIKGTDNKDVSIGPDIVINLLLSMIDRRIDRWRAARRQEIIATHFPQLKALGSIDQASQYLMSSLLSFQNLSDSEKQQFSDTVDRNKKGGSDVNVQFQALGFLFLTVVGEENFASALAKAKEIQGPAAPPPVPATPTVAPPAIPASGSPPPVPATPTVAPPAIPTSASPPPVP